MLEKLKKRWNLKTNWDVLAVFLVFSINGSLSVILTKPVYNYFNFSSETISPWVYWPVKIIFTTMVYQITFPIVGWCFGQFDFAYNFVKKTLSRMGLGFLFKK